MSFEELDKHNTIGWDIDGTLIDNDASGMFRQFIFSNPNKRHYIVTFRTHDLLDYLERDLAEAGFKDINIFEKVFSVPSNIWLGWVLLQQDRKQKKKIGKLLLPETTYMEWKGFQCRQEGITALVDDDIINTKMGCDRFGIKLFDSKKF